MKDLRRTRTGDMTAAAEISPDKVGGREGVWMTDTKREGDERLNDGWMRKRRRRAVCVCVFRQLLQPLGYGREGGRGEREKVTKLQLCLEAVGQAAGLRPTLYMPSDKKEPCYLPAARKKARAKNVKGEIAEIGEKEGEKDAEEKGKKRPAG